MKANDFMRQLFFCSRRDARPRPRPPFFFSVAESTAHSIK